MAYISQESICKTLITDANKAMKIGAYEQAENSLMEAVQRLEAATGKMHPRLAAVLLRLGDFYAARGRMQEAEQQFRRALNIYETAFGDGTLDVAICLQHLSDCILAQSRPEEAKLLRDRSNKILTDRLSNFGFASFRKAS